VTDFDLSGALRRIRRRADLSQRQLAESCEISQSVVARAESGYRDIPVALLRRAAALAGLRLALLDEDGKEVPGMAPDAVRDLGRRRFPAHLDTVHSDERWSRYEDQYYRPRPWYTVDRDRAARDALRRRDGTPHDHLLPHPGDSPAERRSRRNAEARRRQKAELQRRRAAGDVRDPEEFACSCPPQCDELDVGERPRHAPECPCECDLG
jgi:transcriptional regulator with XRE-family HTH domain